jgi:hypothetical protein
MNIALPEDFGVDAEVGSLRTNPRGGALPQTASRSLETEEAAWRSCPQSFEQPDLPLQSSPFSPRKWGCQGQAFGVPRVRAFKGSACKTERPGCLVDFGEGARPFAG